MGGAYGHLTSVGGASGDLTSVGGASGTWVFKTCWVVRCYRPWRNFSLITCVFSSPTHRSARVSRVSCKGTVMWLHPKPDFDLNVIIWRRVWLLSRCFNSQTGCLDAHAEHFHIKACCLKTVTASFPLFFYFFLPPNDELLRASDGVQEVSLSPWTICAVRWFITVGSDSFAFIPNESRFHSSHDF